MFQKAPIRADLAFGIPGEIRFDGPNRTQPGTLVSTDAANNVFGRVFSRATDGTWRAGDPAGDGVQFAILTNPKEFVSRGTAAGSLAPNLTIPNQTIGSFTTMGFIVGQTLTAADVGYVIHYAKATGAISAQPVGTAVPGTSLLLANATVDRVPQNAPPGLFLLRITN